MKRIAFCFDGTWNRLDAPNPTNVVKLAQSVTPTTDEPITQIVHYDQGVGTGRLDYWRGGLFGAGLLDHIADAYRFLIFNYEVGDELYVFGFSRGAYTARAFVGFLKNCSIVEREFAGRISEAISLYKSRLPNHQAQVARFQDFRWRYAPDICVDEADDQWRCANIPGYKTGQAPILRIRYVGVWDTVGSLGVPDTLLISPFINRRYKFYDTDLSEMVVQARHAVAIDERRKSFSPTLWTNISALNSKLQYADEDPDAPYQQQWFPGVHGGVGGGGDITGLSDAALDWVLTGARHAGLKVDISPNSVLFNLHPNFCAPLDNVTKKRFSLASFAMAHLPQTDRSPGPSALSQVSASTQARWRAPAAQLPGKCPYRPKPLEGVASTLDAPVGASPFQATASAAASVHAGTRPTFYTVVRGDQLRSIALRFYGDANRAEDIFNGNPMLTEKDRIYVGQVLRLPQIQATGKRG